MHVPDSLADAKIGRRSMIVGGLDEGTDGQGSNRDRGGFRDLGLACTECLVDEGATVMGGDLVDWTFDPPAGGSCLFQPVDVSDEASVAELVAATVGAFGRIDGLVNAAGVAGGGPVHSLGQDEWHRVISVNTHRHLSDGQACHRAHARATHCRRLPGFIVTVASIEGLEGTVGGSVLLANPTFRRAMARIERDVFGVWPA